MASTGRGIPSTNASNCRRKHVSVYFTTVHFRRPTTLATCVWKGREFCCLQEATKTLNEGNCVIVFPEGTRSVTGRLQPFKKGFFRLATEMQDVRILPIGKEAYKE